jgi:hypothetical protein
MSTIGKELALGVTLTLESCAGEVQRVRAALREATQACEACRHSYIVLAKVWVRLENARRALDAAGARE